MDEKPADTFINMCMQMEIKWKLALDLCILHVPTIGIWWRDICRQIVWGGQGGVSRRGTGYWRHVFIAFFRCRSSWVYPWLGWILTTGHWLLGIPGDVLDTRLDCRDSVNLNPGDLNSSCWVDMILDGLGRVLLQGLGEERMVTFKCTPILF